MTPCPFCDSLDIRTSATQDLPRYPTLAQRRNANWTAYAYCRNCGARGPQVTTIREFGNLAHDLALQAWEGRGRNG